MSERWFDLPDLPTWDGRPRGPVTEAEALAVHQHSWAAGLGRRRGTGVGAPIVQPQHVPTEDTDGRVMAAYRLDPEALAYARARAHLEPDLTMSAVVDKLLRLWAAQPPGWWPTAWGPIDIDDVPDPDLPGT